MFFCACPVLLRALSTNWKMAAIFFRPLAELPRTIFRRGELILMGKSSSTGVWGQSPHEGKGEYATLINGLINWRLTSKFQSHRGLTLTC